MSGPRGKAALWARRWGPVVLWVTVILVLTSWPSPLPSVEVSGEDKIAHFGVYAILGGLVARAIVPPRAARFLLAMAFAIATFGALDELHQLLIPNRDAAVADWIADLCGGSLGLLAIHHFLRSRPTTVKGVA